MQGAGHRATGTRRLTASSLTFGQVPFEERVRVAASAGFDGIGLSADVYTAALRDGFDDSDMRALLDEHQLVVTEVEFLSDWFLGDDRPASAGAKETTLLHMARAFGADRVNVGLFEKHPLDEMCRNFAALCERAGDVKIALEFMPFGGIPGLDTAWEMVRSADRHNAGLMLDVWHWVRAGTTTEDFARIAADRIFAIQLCDVARDRLDEPRFESLHHRLVPGDGDDHATSLMAFLVAHGVDADICVEVMSDELAASGPLATATTVFAAATEVLSHVGIDHRAHTGQ